MSRRSVAFLLIISMLSIWILSGCSVKKEGLEEITISKEPQSQIVISIDEFPTTINPLMDMDVLGEVLYPLIYQTISDVSESIEEINDRHYKINLRNGVLLHNGEVLTADFIEKMLNHIIENDGEVYNDIKKNISEIIIKNKNELDIILKDSAVNIVESLFSIYIFNPEKYLIGTGDYMAEVIDENTILLKLFKGNNTYQNIMIRANITTESLNEFENGQTDAVWLPKKREIISRVRKIDTGRLVTIPGNAIFSLGINHHSKKMNEVKLRKALYYLIDRKEIIKIIWDTLADEIFFPLVNFAENPQMSVPRDLDYASELLVDLGYIYDEEDVFRSRDGEILTLNYYCYPESEWTYELGEILKNQFSHIGINIQINYISYDELQKILTRDYKSLGITEEALFDILKKIDIFPYANKMTSTATPYTYFGNNENNIFGYNTPAKNEIIDNFSSSLIEEIDINTIEQWYQLTLDEVPLIPIARPMQYWIYSKKLGIFSNITITKHILDSVKE